MQNFIQSVADNSSLRRRPQTAKASSGRNFGFKSHESDQM